MLVANGTLIATFVCVDSAGAPTAPTGTPTGVLFKNGSSTGVTVTVTMSTAVGVASATIPSDAVQGDVFHITITGTVSGTEYKVSSDPETVFAAAVPSNVTQFGGANGTFSGGRPEVNTTHWGGTAIASAVVNANAVQISGDSAAADNLEAAADGTGYNLGGGSIIAASVTGAVTAGTVSDKTGYSLVTAPLDAAGVRAAVGLAAANMDTQFATLATASALSALVTTVGVAGVGLTEAGGTGDQFTAIPWSAAWDAEVQSECTDAIVAAGLPRSGVTLRYTQVAANSGSKTADVSIGAAS